jgi:quercetin dioxygenase-like cupin family protein
MQEGSMFQSAGRGDYFTMLPGIERRTLVHGERTLMVEFRLRGGGSLPRHSHPHEQTGYLLRGRIRLEAGGETRELLPGDSWCIAGGIEHGAEILEDSLALEVFSPPRADYLPADGT